MALSLSQLRVGALTITVDEAHIDGEIGHLTIGSGTIGNPAEGATLTLTGGTTRPNLTSNLED